MPHKAINSATVCVSSEIGNDTAFGSVTPPLYLSSTYKFSGLDKIGKYDYGRSGNPNRDALANTISKMEHGAGAIITSSGMAAIDLVLNLVPNNTLVIAPHDCYSGTHRLLESRQKQGRFTVMFIDQNNPRQIEHALDEKPSLILIETPSNPLMRVVDIASVAKAAHSVGALVVCDNTFLSPARQNPIKLGADIVVHSSTKYINGHSDVVGGIVVTREKSQAELLIWWANCTGVTGAPFDSFLTLRGLRTLHARLDVQEKNAQKIATFLNCHPLVSRVYYPGLTSDPGYELANRQQSGPGAMLSFEITASRTGIGEFLSGTNFFQLAESLGGTESLICHPASMTHRSMSKEARKIAGISERLIRLSVGLEHSKDLIAELTALFSNITKSNLL